MTTNSVMGLIPGLALFGPAFGLPLCVLAAVLERPFYTLGGISHRTIWYSLQANLGSLVAGCLASFIAGAVFGALGSLAVLFVVSSVLSVAVSTIAEGLYLAERQEPNESFWKWIAIGNIWSAAVSIGLFFLIQYLGKRYPDLPHEPRSAEAYLYYVAFGGSAIIIVFAFWRTRQDNQRSQDRRGAPSMEKASAGEM